MVKRFGLSNGHVAPTIKPLVQVVERVTVPASPERQPYLLTDLYDRRVRYTDMPADVEWEQVAQFAHYLYKRGKFSRSQVVKYCTIGARAYNRIIAHMQAKGYAIKRRNNHMKLTRDGALWLDVFLREYHENPAWDDSP